jgi:nicotinate-nucleotide adenylyltransferase
MVELAVAGCRDIVASAIDAPRSDGRPNYTIDVLAAIKADLGAEDELFFLLGADAFLSLRQWYRAAELPFVCGFVVAGRPGFSIDDLRAALPEGVRAVSDDAYDQPNVVRWVLGNEAGQLSNLYLMPDLHLDISATEIRAAIAGEESAAGVLCPAVSRYISDNGLYR